METLNHMESLKLTDHPGENVAVWRDTILVDDERLESAGTFNPKHLGYIICIFENTYDSRFHIWETQKYKEVMDFQKKLFVCDEGFTKTDYIITYGSLVQEAMR